MAKCSSDSRADLRRNAESPAGLARFRSRSQPTLCKFHGAGLKYRPYWSITVLRAGGRRDCGLALSEREIDEHIIAVRVPCRV